VTWSKKRGWGASRGRSSTCRAGSTLLAACLGLVACTTSSPPTPAPAGPGPAAVDSDADTQADNHTDAAESDADTGPRLEVTSTGDAAVKHSITSFDGHSLAVWSKRPAQARGAFLLVHGRTWSGLPDFDLQVPGEHLSLMDRLVEQGYAAYAVDLRGYGATERDASGWNDPDKAAGDVVASLDWIHEREGTEVVLLGWSYGSIHAHIAALRRPEHVQALVLYGHPRGPRGRSTPEPSPDSPAYARNSRQAARSDFITRGTISEQAIQAYVDACHAADPVRADWHRLHLFDEADSTKLAVPTLAIRGDNDPVASDRTQRRLVKLVPTRSAYVEIPNADHAAHLEHPEVFVQEVLGFVAGGAGN